MRIEKEKRLENVRKVKREGRRKDRIKGIERKEKNEDKIDVILGIVGGKEKRGKWKRMIVKIKEGEIEKDRREENNRKVVKWSLNLNY